MGERVSQTARGGATAEHPSSCRMDSTAANKIARGIWSSGGLEIVTRCRWQVNRGSGNWRCMRCIYFGIPYDDPRTLEVRASARTFRLVRSRALALGASRPKRQAHSLLSVRPKGRTISRYLNRFPRVARNGYNNAPGLGCRAMCGGAAEATMKLNWSRGFDRAREYRIMNTRDCSEGFSMKRPRPCGR
jgi:hypothetical protein